MGNPRKLSVARFLPAMVVSLLLSSASLFATTFDFENQAATYNPATMSHAPGALTSLSLTEGAITLTISRQNNIGFDLVNNPALSSQMPLSWGKVSLDPFVNTTGGGFVLNFSQAISNFSIEYGDFDGDSDTATLSAFSGRGATGSLLASATDNYGPQSVPVFDTVSLSAAGINSILITGTSFSHGILVHPEQSVYYDNIIVESTPEPSTILLTALAGTFLVLFVRQRQLSADEKKLANRARRLNPHVRP